MSLASVRSASILAARPRNAGHSSSTTATPSCGPESGACRAPRHRICGKCARTLAHSAWVPIGHHRGISTGTPHRRGYVRHPMTAYFSAPATGGPSLDALLPAQCSLLVVIFSLPPRLSSAPTFSTSAFVLRTLSRTCSVRSFTFLRTTSCSSVRIAFSITGSS